MCSVRIRDRCGGKLFFGSMLREWSVHADVLRMAKSKEKRERIKWFHARCVFFGLRLPPSHTAEQCIAAFAAGLTLACKSENEDARHLASLFPNEPPASKEEAVAVFLACRDPRCLCWAVRLGAGPMDELLRASAEAGYAWGQVAFAR